MPYSARGAVQDAALAMGRDVVRALVEVITNASDSYGRLTRDGQPIGDGRIDILVERRRGDFSQVIVRDHAQGMRRRDLHTKVLQIGERHSDDLDRGFMGRGAKDAAFFGKETYETVQDAIFSQATIQPDLTSYTDSAPERPSTGTDRERLGLGPNENGTQVTVFVDRNRFSIPRHDNLRRRLERNVQLRRILSDPHRLVRLIDRSRPDRAPDPIRFTFSKDRVEVLRRPLHIEGYPEATGELILYRHPVPLEDDRGPERLSGILVEDDTAVHEATYFGLDGRQGALIFTGELRCPYLRTLQNEVERGGVGDRRNPIPIITRSRAGLQRDHPFTALLAKFVEAALRPLVEEQEQALAEQGGRESSQTKDRLRAAARELGQRFLEEQRRLEVETTESGGEPTAQEVAVGLRVIPPRVFIEPGAVATFTVQSWPESFADTARPEVWVAEVELADQDVVELSTKDVLLEPDPKNPERRRGSFQVTAVGPEDATLVEIRLGGLSEIVIVDVAAAKDEPVPAPTRLMFAQSTYRIRPGQTKRLTLMAPTDLTTAHGLTVALTTTRPEITVPDKIQMHPRQSDDGRSWCEADLDLTLPEGVSGRVRASLGPQAATCQVSFSEPEGHTPFQFILADEAPRYDSQGRADWILPKGVLTLKVFAGHRSLRPYFGDRMEHQEELACRILIAEVLATEVALRTMRRALRPGGEEGPVDAQAFTNRLKELQTRYLRIAHEVLVPEIVGRA
jgi:hypothetical protein